VSIRNVRRDVLKKLAKLELSEDDVKGLESEVQDLTDTYVKKVEELVAKKNKDLTTL
jgi:ribosome recycling factor